MNWTEKEAKRILGDRYYPPSQKGIETEIPAFNFNTPDDGMNATERRYADRVLNPQKYTKEIIEWFYEGVTFNLAPKTTFTPDFFIIRHNRLDIIEIKGQLQDDASVKFKWARDLYPWFYWEMLRLDKEEFVRVRI